MTGRSVEAAAEPRPLSGVTVAITRARAQAAPLAERLRELGAELVLAPVIRIEPLPGPPPDLHRYDLICLTSANGVDALFERLKAAGLDARAFPPREQALVAAIGPATARALGAHGLTADLVPAEALGEALAAALKDLPVRRALVVRARQARDVIPEALRARHAEVDVLAVYQTVADRLGAGQVAAVLNADYVTFTSGSTVHNLLDAVGGAEVWAALGQARPRMVSIGPATSAALREHGFEPDLEAASHDVGGVVDAILAAHLERAKPRQEP
ncbi:MAG: uroporphyrinogen-III synthase [Solirubrobacteraceae bacterium]